MKYMLDTNVCIYILNKNPISYIRKLDNLEKKYTLAISSIVLSELQFGVFNSKHQEQNQINVNSFVSKLEVLDFKAQCALYYGKIRADLKRRGIIIGNNDLLIASHAIYENATLVTNNTSEFKRVRNLKLEDWLEY
jgi:tRNA(fMet)-specific endonuclease VapC